MNQPYLSIYGMVGRFPMNEESKLSARNPGPPPQSPSGNRSVPPLLPGGVVAVVAIFLLSGVPALSLHALQDPPVVQKPVLPKPVEAPKEDSEKSGEVTPAKQVSAKAERWIDQLGSSDWEKREEAAAELKKLGGAAKSALEKALKNADPEVASKAEELLEALESPVIREVGRRGSEPGGRRRIISGPGGIVTLELGGDSGSRRKVEIGSAPGEVEGAQDEILKEIREIEKQMEREFNRGFTRGFPGRIPFPDMEDLFDIPTGGGVRWQGSTTLGGQSSRNEYLNGKLSLSIETRDDLITIEPLGLVLESVHPVLKVHLPQAAEAGYLIKNVRPGSPAEAAGLRQWDLLLRDGDLKLRNENELATAFRMPRPDRPVEVIRQGQKILLPKTEKVPAGQEKK